MEGSPRRSASEQFGRMAASYAASHTHAVAGRLVNFGGFVAGRRYGTAIDVGTGPGFTAFAVAPYADRVIATDVAPAMLDQLRVLRAQRGAANVRPVLAAAEALPFAARSVDLVTCRTAAHHFTDVARWLAEVDRVLARGGLLVVGDTAAPGDPDAAAWMHEIELRRDPSHVRNLSASEWRARVEEAGLRVTQETPSQVHLQFPDWAERAGVGQALMEELREALTAAPAPMRRAFGIDPHADGTIDFHWDVVVLKAEKP